MHRHHLGFTIVELLIVIVVIGILATITVVSYTGISRRAAVATITSDLDSAFKKFKLYQVENSGYPTGIELNCSTPTDPAKICLKPSPNNQYTLTTDNSVASNQTFCLTILNTAINTKYSVTNEGAQSSGGCPHTLTLIAGTGGTATGSGTYSDGSIQTITATPDNYHTFSSWTGDTGCSGTASHTITMDVNKTCTASFTLSPDWYAGVASTVMAGKYVRSANLSGTYQYETSYTAVTSPQGAIGLDPNHPSNMSLVSPQTNPSVDFSAYPAQNACQAVNGRLPNTQEGLAIYTNRASYGNNFSTSWYWSSTEYDSTFAYFINYYDGSTGTNGKANGLTVRCVAG